MTREREIDRFFQFIGTHAKPVQVVGKVAVRVSVPDPDQLDDEDLNTLPMAGHLPRTCRGLKRAITRLVGRKILKPVFGRNSRHPKSKIFEVHL